MLVCSILTAICILARLAQVIIMTKQLEKARKDNRYAMFTLAQKYRKSAAIGLLLSATMFATLLTATETSTVTTLATIIIAATTAFDVFLFERRRSEEAKLGIFGEAQEIPERVSIRQRVKSFMQKNRW